MSNTYLNRNIFEILKNISWLFFDKLLRLTVGLFVGIWVARYLGPSKFGLLSYTNAFTALFGAVASLGLDRIVVREIVKTPSLKNELLGTAFVLKLIAGTFVLVMSIIVIYGIRSDESITLCLVGLSAAGYIFQSVNVIDLYYQAKVQSKLSVIAFNSAFFLMTLVKIELLLSGASLIAFGIVGLGEIILGSLFIVILYIKTNNLFRWRFEHRLARQLLLDSWPLMFSNAAVMIYMRIDQIMIGEMLDEKELGFYSAAVKVSELFYIIPSIIANSIYPSIVESKSQGTEKYNNKLQMLYDGLFLLALIISVFVTLQSDWMTMVLYGDNFSNSGVVLKILVWSCVFVFFSTIWSCDVLSRNKQKIFIKYDLISISINITLNLILIPQYGISGSALATTLSVPITYMLMCIFVKSERMAMRCLIKSFVFISIFKFACNNRIKV